MSTRRRTYQFHETINEITTWTSYLHQSVERFEEAFKDQAKLLTETREKKLLAEVYEALSQLNKDARLLQSRSHRLRGQR